MRSLRPALRSWDRRRGTESKVFNSSHDLQHHSKHLLMSGDALSSSNTEFTSGLPNVHQIFCLRCLLAEDCLKGQGSVQSSIRTLSRWLGSVVRGVPGPWGVFLWLTFSAWSPAGTSPWSRVVCSADHCENGLRWGGGGGPQGAGAGQGGASECPVHHAARGEDVKGWGCWLGPKRLREGRGSPDWRPKERAGTAARAPVAVGEKADSRVGVKVSERPHEGEGGRARPGLPPGPRARA